MNRYKLDSWPEIFLFCSIALAVVAALTFMLALAFMWAWNIVMPLLFGLPQIDLWISFASLVILTIIGSFFKNPVSYKK